MWTWYAVRHISHIPLGKSGQGIFQYFQESTLQWAKRSNFGASKRKKMPMTTVPVLFYSCNGREDITLWFRYGRAETKREHGCVCCSLCEQKNIRLRSNNHIWDCENQLNEGDIFLSFNRKTGHKIIGVKKGQAYCQTSLMTLKKLSRTRDHINNNNDTHSNSLASINCSYMAFWGRWRGGVSFQLHVHVATPTHIYELSKFII